MCGINGIIRFDDDSPEEIRMWKDKVGFKTLEYICFRTIAFSSLIYKSLTGQHLRIEE